ncbi:MAG: hypothetical protein ABEI99_06895 [Halobaculum sp.]
MSDDSRRRIDRDDNYALHWPEFGVYEGELRSGPDDSDPEVPRSVIVRVGLLTDAFRLVLLVAVSALLSSVLVTQAVVTDTTTAVVASGVLVVTLDGTADRVLSVSPLRRLSGVVAVVLFAAWIIGTYVVSDGDVPRVRSLLTTLLEATTLDHTPLSNTKY